MRSPTPVEMDTLRATGWVKQRRHGFVYPIQKSEVKIVPRPKVLAVLNYAIHDVKTERIQFVVKNIAAESIDATAYERIPIAVAEQTNSVRHSIIILKVKPLREANRLQLSSASRSVVV